MRPTAVVIGLVQGREVQAAAQLSLEPTGLGLQWEQAAPWILGFDGLDGMRIGDGEATLYLTGHDLLELRGDAALRPFLRALQDALVQVPDLLRSVRHFGALHASPRVQAAHDRWFAPLRTVRQALIGVSDPLRQVALADAEDFRTAIRQACEDMAAVAEPAGGAPQRALAARLEAATLGMQRAIDAMGLAADTLRRSEDETRLADWRRWITTLRGVARACEAGWIEAEALLP